MISEEFLAPVSESLLAKFSSERKDRLIHKIRIHREVDGLPDLNGVKIALIAVHEDRASSHNQGCDRGGDAVRYQLYKLFPGEWQTLIADLGNIYRGEKPEDTYAALQLIVAELLALNICVMVIGGSQDLTYPMYRAYDKLEQSVNLITADPRFDLGESQNHLNDENYLSSIILNKPHNLFNFANIGYQTYFVSPEERDLMDRMYFDTYRIGELRPLAKIEPVIRNSDIISIDMSVARAAEAPGHALASPNGFSGEEMCAITRYAGLSDKLSQIGIFGYNPSFDHQALTAQLIAEMIWYFIEGVNARLGDFPVGSKKDYLRFTVLMEDGKYEMVFYKSPVSGRWWVQAPDGSVPEKNQIRHVLIPCTADDYEKAMQGEFPPVWWNTLKRMA